MPWKYRSEKFPKASRKSQAYSHSAYIAPSAYKINTNKSPMKPGINKPKNLCTGVCISHLSLAPLPRQNQGTFVAMNENTSSQPIIIIDAIIITIVRIYFDSFLLYIRISIHPIYNDGNRLR